MFINNVKEHLESNEGDPELLVYIPFNYTHYDKKHGATHKSIVASDRIGMHIIETGNPDAFKEYLLEFDNTICGRHPISVFLHMLKNSAKVDA
ncbi:hypothetical protein L3X38_008044 [Prunus dulcis]|uniref:Uncharacterized protein n=1 Tax=Prunus dulcis TaxID=3755 RepID=A0AAD4ZVX4_PRUDU|nr:hypothetical protein L3X38_008044 [Prunus dulcis]